MPDELWSLRLQIANIPGPVMTAWRARYAAGGDIELNAFTLVDKVAATLHVQGKQVDAHAIWMHLADQCGQVAKPSPEMMAATALVGLATGLRTQGFDRPETP